MPGATVFDQIKKLNEEFKFVVENAEQFSINKNEINTAESSAGSFQRYNRYQPTTIIVIQKIYNSASKKYTI